MNQMKSEVQLKKKEKNQQSNKEPKRLGLILWAADELP